MADILIPTTVSSRLNHTESTANQTEENSHTYNGHDLNKHSLTDDYSTNFHKTKEMFRKLDTNSKSQRIENEQSPTAFVPLVLPTNAVKRMDRLNTIFVKPIKIEQIVFQDNEKQEQWKSSINESDDDRFSPPLFFELPGLPDLDDEDEKKSNDTKRVKFSTAPIRVYSTYSPSEYDRRNEDIDPLAASAEYELEKRIEKMDVFNVEVEKGPNGLGISVLGMGVGADNGLEKLGIFVKTLHPQGVIAEDGRIQIGDQIIEVNNQSLVGVTHAYATNVLKGTSGVVKFVIGREKDLEKSEILGLIQRSLQLDQERDDISRTFQQYHDAYYERNFNDNEDDTLKDDESFERKIPNEYEMEILKQCYESLEKNLDTTEKEKEKYQELYQQAQMDLKDIEEKYNQSKLLIEELENRENQLRQEQSTMNEQYEKRIAELMKKVEELEKIIASSVKQDHISSQPPEVPERKPNRSRASSSHQFVSTDRNATLAASAFRCPSISSDKISTASHYSTFTNNKSADQLDQNSFINRINSKHVSTPSLGEPEVIKVKTHVLRIPSLEEKLNDDVSLNEYIEIKDWTADHCIQWLTAQQLTSLIPAFLNRNIDGEKLLLLDSAKMKAIGIKSSKDRDQLKLKIKELKHAELNRLREQSLDQTRFNRSVPSGNRLRSSSLTKLRERKFFSSSSGK